MCTAPNGPSETGYYPTWETETHRQHRDYERRGRAEQRQYWDGGNNTTTATVITTTITISFNGPAVGPANPSYSSRAKKSLRDVDCAST